jgi:hypothetical protein
MAMNQHAATQETMEAVFLWSAPQPLLCIGAVNTPLLQQLNYNNKIALFLRGPCRGAMSETSFSFGVRAER